MTTEFDRQEEVLQTMADSLRSAEARIDLERNRADEAERKLEHELEHHDGDWEVDDHAAEAEYVEVEGFVWCTEVFAPHLSNVKCVPGRPHEPIYRLTPPSE